MKYEICPYLSVGNINFEMKRGEVRKKFNNDYKEFRKSQASKSSTDDFGCCHVYYAQDETVEAIEFFENVELIFNSNNLIGLPYNEAKEIFNSIDSDLHQDDYGFTSFKFGVGAYTPNAKTEPNEPIESVIVFRKGYYD